MNTLLLRLLPVCGMLLAGDGFPYGDSLSQNVNRDDDYGEEYHLRKVPKLKATPHKKKQFLLTWFPVEAQEIEQAEDDYRDRKYLMVLDGNGTRDSNLTARVRENLQRVKDFRVKHRISPNLTSLIDQTSKKFKKVGNYFEGKRLKHAFSRLVHPLRYRSSLKECRSRACYRCVGPSVRIRPKTSRAVNRTTTTVPPKPDFSTPKKFRIYIDLNSSEKPFKQERVVQVHDKYQKTVEVDKNSTTDTAGEITDLAGRVTRVWHSVLGSRHVPDIRDVKFYLYTRRNVIKPELLRVNYELIGRKIRANPQYRDVECVDISPEDIDRFVRISDDNRRIIRSNFLNIMAPTKILIHGYTGSYKDSRMVKIKDAYLTNGRYNVIQVDWEILAAPPCYIRVTQHSKFVGETIAKFLDGLYLIGLNMSLVHLIGFSLGAQVAGFVGNNATITPVCRITGLDPALPLFLHTQPSGHLDRLDAKFVDVIHTCGGILAMLNPLGHVDFYPNGGTRQPGCEFSNLKCSHSRAPQYFAESVTSQKKFKGRLCLNWEEYVAGNCDNGTNISFMGEPCSRRSVSGKYYLLTKSKEPFVL